MVAPFPVTLISGPTAVTLVNVAVQGVASTWLHTARPRYTAAPIVMVCDEIVVHVTPSLDREAVNRLPTRASRTQYGGRNPGCSGITLPASPAVVRDSKS